MLFNIICASHNYKILEKNFGRTNLYKSGEMILMRGFNNISRAYNKVCVTGKDDQYNCYIHHDVFMADDFADRLSNAIQQINALDKNWGVLGVTGAAMINGQRKFIGHVNDRGMEDGTSNNLPHEVQTLDELLLITKGDFVFDEQFDLHFYGADVCMQAIKQGRKNYAIDAYVYHNSNTPMGYRSNSFRECEAKFKAKWKDLLPIATTCTLLQ